MNAPRSANMPKVPIHQRKWPSAKLNAAPTWCAVDLRDGNQALPNPMTPDQKKEYFDLLIDIGFKEIEVGFPSASTDDYRFCRQLIENKWIPDDVTISVLTQAREDLIEKTLEALQGVRRAIIHFYVATSTLHTKFVFGKNKSQVLEMIVQATRQIKQGITSLPSSITLEFSPEEFTDSDLAFTSEICDAVIETWDPPENQKVILNLPQTVERRLPNEYADMIEEFIRRQNDPDKSIISIHTHNDMGCGVAATMQALLAGADRVEGTLLGHGERTGNVDLITVALNLEYLGINSGLTFQELPAIIDKVADITAIPVHPRHPYAGELVFTAFSGSHQDAIHKGMSKKEEINSYFQGWKLPYLHIDPLTIGRSYDRFIRINNQSGKAAVAHIMERDHNIKLPRWMQIDLAKCVQKYTDEKAREIESKELWDIFQERYIGNKYPLELIAYWPRPADENPEIIEGEVCLRYKGKEITLNRQGNGPISAFMHAIRKLEGLEDFSIEDYEEGTRGVTADAEAVCFIKLFLATTKATYIGVGLGSNIDQAAVRAVVAAINSAFLSS